MHARAMELGARPGLRFASAAPGDRPYLLVEPGGLSLVAPDGGRLQAELSGGRLGWRLRHGGGRRQAVARAVGLRSGRPTPRVLDATAGLGRDAAVLATLGCPVLALERHPAIHALLQDALERARSIEGADGPAALAALELRFGDSTALLLEAAAGGGPVAAFAPDVVLLDPMHPPRRKSALPRLEMRLFRALLGEDLDQGALLGAALGSGARRVVVKRPAHLPPLVATGSPDTAPAHAVEGRTTRFDVYLPRSGA